MSSIQLGLGVHTLHVILMDDGVCQGERKRHESLGYCVSDVAELP